MLPGSFLVLMSAGQVGVYVGPSDEKYALKDLVHDFTLFALHPSKPYVRLVEECTHSDCQHIKYAWGWLNYLSRLQNLYAPGYPGPFTIGVWWHKLN